MKMTLYHGEPNGPSLSVLAAMFEKGVEVELRSIDLASGARHALAQAAQPEVAMSVEGEGPVLVVDGEGMTDSVFLACYFDEIGSGPLLRPVDPYARWEVMMWCRQAIERLAPAAAYLGLRAHPSTKIPDDIASEDLAHRWGDAVAGRFDEDKLADSRTKVIQAVEKCEVKLADGRDWLMGDFSIADLETYGWLAEMPELVTEAFEQKPLTSAWLDRVAARPSVQSALALATGAAEWAPGPEINRWG
jgi:GSH-dependent disulfide-bond oxidoreductase